MVSGADQDDGQVNLPLGVSVALGEIAIMVAVSVLVKLVSADIDTVTVLLFRYALCLPLLVVVAVWQRGGKALSITAPGTLAIRIVTGLISLACFYAALDLMALSLVTVLFQTLTLFVTLLAPMMLGERVGWRRWTAVTAGFGGTMLLLNPAAGGWTLTGILLGLGSPFFGALMKKHNVQSLPELMDVADELGVRLVACQMSMGIMGVTREELREGVEFGGVASYLKDAARSRLTLFI